MVYLLMTLLCFVYSARKYREYILTSRSSRVLFACWSVVGGGRRAWRHRTHSMDLCPTCCCRVVTIAGFLSVPILALLHVRPPAQSTGLVRPDSATLPLSAIPVEPPLLLPNTSTLKTFVNLSALQLRGRRRRRQGAGSMMRLKAVQRCAAPVMSLGMEEMARALLGESLLNSLSASLPRQLL